MRMFRVNVIGIAMAAAAASVVSLAQPGPASTASVPAASPAALCAGYQDTYTGTLASGTSVLKGYPYRAHGVWQACLVQPAGADFTLELQLHVAGGWTTVATASGTGPEETLTYDGTNDGTFFFSHYRIRISAVSGSGDYVVGVTAPPFVG